MVEDIDNVRLPIWTGTQDVAGLWLAAARIAGPAREQRLLHAWRAGSKLLRFADGDLLRFPTPVSLACEGLPALPVCAIAGGMLASAPLKPGESTRCQGCDLLLIEGARIHGLQMAQAQVIDLSLAIDIGAYALHDTFDCSHSMPSIARLDRLSGKDIRTLLGDAIPPPSPERDVFLKLLAQSSSAEKSGARQKLAKGTIRERIGIRTQRAAGWLAGWILRAFGEVPANPAGAPTATGKQATPATGAVPARRTWQMPQAWRERLARLAQLTRISKLIGWRQGAYLRKLMEMFEEADLDEALRHALPIDGSSESLGQAFASPGRRENLELSAGLAARASIGLDEEFRKHLRGVYRKTFERLDRAGRIDEAVFVLAELLNVRKEALDYLEKHQRFDQAAELALRWDMPAATLVRLLLLAGDWQRAVQVARRDNEFAGVIAALAKTHPEIVIRLRLAWGESLADRGDWLAAVEAVWPVPQARNLAAHWLTLAEKAGEEMSARALVRRAMLLPDTVDVYSERIVALARDAQATQARAALADALLLVERPTVAVTAIAAATLPAIAADRAGSANALGKKQLNKLANLANDAFLRADLPDWSLPNLQNVNDFWLRTSAIAFDPPAAGLLPIHDVVALADRQYLVALGEAGAIVIDRDGRERQRFAVPAYRLVISSNQSIALAIAPREAFSRVTRLDLTAHSATDLGTVRMRASADSFDGVAWSLVSEDRILVVDTAKSLHDVLWHVGDLPGTIVATRYTPTNELYLLRTANGLEVWNYALPTRRLITREAVELDPDLPVLLLQNGVVQPQAQPVENDSIRIDYPWFRQTRSVSIPLDGATPASVHCHAVGSAMLVAVVLGDKLRFGLFRLLDGICLAGFDWPAGTGLRWREQGRRLFVFDLQGRMIDIDPHAALPRGITLT